MSTAIESDWENTRLKEEIESLRRQLVDVESDVDTIAAHNVELQQQLHAQQICHEHVVAEKDAVISRLQFALADTEALELGTAEQLAATNAEIERLSRLNSSYSNLAKAQEGQLTALRNRLYELKGADKTLDSERDANAILTAQLAASQAREQQLRVFVETLWQIIDDIDTYSDMAKSDDKAFRAMVEGRQKDRWKTGIECDGYSLHHKALAIPQDTAALEAVIARAGEVMRERCRKVAFDMAYADSMAVDVSQTIRALPGVTLEDIKNG